MTEETPKKKRSALIDIGIILVILYILAAIAIPSFLKARSTHSCWTGCINNMRLIDGGKEQWAMAANQTNGDTVDTAACNDYIKGETTPVCSGGGTYTYNKIGEDPECSLGTIDTNKTSHSVCPGGCGGKHYSHHIFRG